MAYYRSNDRFNGRSNDRFNGHQNYRRTNYVHAKIEELKEVRYPGLPARVQSMEAHLVRMIRIVHANADIRRYTALGIVKRLINQKIITEGGNYVEFLWDKFTVCSKGINHDYRYTEIFFLESFVSSFNIIASVASKALDTFCEMEFAKSAGEAIPHEKDGKMDKITTEILNAQLDSDNNLGNPVDVEK